MATLREGLFGNYYGSLTGTSEPLSKDEMKLNAEYLYKALSSGGFTLNAIAGILGNMQAESTINPGRWQSDDPGNASLGYGLVQWTPSTKYTSWCAEQGLTDPSEMDSNIRRIAYEIQNKIQWIPTDTYNITFEQFALSNESVSYLAKAFLLCYERPADQSESVQNYRSSLAQEWYSYLTNGSLPDIPTQPVNPNKKKRKGYNFLLFNANRRRRAWINQP